MIKYIDRIEGVRYVVFECSIVCWSVEDAGAGILVTIKEGVSARVVIVVTWIEEVWDASKSIMEISVDSQVKGIKEIEGASSIGR